MTAAQRTIAAGVLLAVLVARGNQLIHDHPQPAPSTPRPANLFGLDATLPRDFAGYADEAHRLCGVMAAMADYLEADGRDEQPQVGTVFAFADLYDRAMSAPPWSVSVASSSGLEAGWAELGKRLGSGPETMDAARRASAIEWLRAAAYVLGGV